MRYRVTQLSYIGEHLVEAGDVVEVDPDAMRPGTNLQPAEPAEKPKRADMRKVILSAFLACALAPAAFAQPTALPAAPFQSRLQSWTTATRPRSADPGTTGLNTTTGLLEAWTGTVWSSQAGSGAPLNQPLDIGTGVFSGASVSGTTAIVQCQTFTSSVTWYERSPTAPVSVYEIGGAGGGGGGGTIAGGGSGSGGGSGASGSFASFLSQPASLFPSSVAVTVGAAGVGGAAGAAGGNGGNTCFGTHLACAYGGDGGGLGASGVSSTGGAGASANQFGEFGTAGGSGGSGGKSGYNSIQVDLGVSGSGTSATGGTSGNFNNSLTFAGAGSGGGLNAGTATAGAGAGINSTGIGVAGGSNTGGNGQNGANGNFPAGPFGNAGGGGGGNGAGTGGIGGNGGVPGGPGAGGGSGTGGGGAGGNGGAGEVMVCQ